jgi:hypothetical protein
MKRLVLSCLVCVMLVAAYVEANGPGRTDWLDDIHTAASVAMIGRSCTAALKVSPNGNGTDGQTWPTAYTTIQAALDAASTDADDCTLIEISPHATFYDINTTGDPTWTGNYILKGTHRIWAGIKNTHASATSIMKFTGHISLVDLAFFQADAVDGVIMTKDGFRINHCGFNSTACDGAQTSIMLSDGSAIKGGIIHDIHMLGHVTHTTGIYMNNVSQSYFDNVNIHFMLKGIQIIHSDSDNNTYNNCEIGACALGLDLDAGNSQHFNEISFHENTRNVDDEVGDHHWVNIRGSFPSTITPDDFTGVTIATGVGADTWTAAPVQVRAAGDNPFRVLGMAVEADANEKFRVRLTDGTTYFRDVELEGNAAAVQRTTANKPGGTEFIFNKGTVISAESKSESGGNNAVIWLEIQEI